MTLSGDVLSASRLRSSIRKVAAADVGLWTSRSVRQLVFAAPVEWAAAITYSV